MAKKWIQKATREMKRKGTTGSFSAAAKRADKSTAGYANEVLANPDDFSPTTRKRAQFAKNVSGFAEGGTVDVPRGTQLNRGGLVKKPKEMEHGGMAYDVTHGSEDVPMEWGRKKLDSGTEQLIQGTEFQVRGRYFNNNDGKGTF